MPLIIGEDYFYFRNAPVYCAYGEFACTCLSMYLLFFSEMYYGIPYLWRFDSPFSISSDAIGF